MRTGHTVATITVTIHTGNLNDFHDAVGQRLAFIT